MIFFINMSVHFSPTALVLTVLCYILTDEIQLTVDVHGAGIPGYVGTT